MRIELPAGTVTVSTVVFWAIVWLSLALSVLICAGTCKGGLYPHADTARGGRGVPHRVVSPSTAVLFWQLPITAGVFLGLGFGNGTVAFVFAIFAAVYSLFVYMYASNAPESTNL